MFSSKGFRMEEDKKSLLSTPIPPSSIEGEKADLKSIPTRLDMEKFASHPDNEFIIPDLHGNAMKLIWHLIRYDFLKLSEKDYKELLDIYLKAEKDECTPDLLQRWEEILEDAEYNPKAGILHLIGDELCDRGANDWLTLKLIEIMHDYSIPFTTKLSNHSLEFILKMETHFWKLKELSTHKKLTEISEKKLDFDCNTILLSSLPEHASASRSLRTFAKLLNEGLIEWSNTDEDAPRGVLEIYKIYLKHLQLVDACVYPETNTLFLITHAPFNIKLLRELAVLFSRDEMKNIKAPILTTEELERVINLVNIKFNLLKNKFLIYKCINDSIPQSYLEINLKWVMQTAFYKLCWNTVAPSALPELAGQGILYDDVQPKQTIIDMFSIHGHTSIKSPYCVDDDFGKGSSKYWSIDDTAKAILLRRPKKLELSMKKKFTEIEEKTDEPKESLSSKRPSHGK